MKITTYAELEEMIRMFSSGRARLVLIHSPAGTGKTSTALNILDNSDFCHITTHCTSLAFYKKLYEAVLNKQKIFIEDCESLFFDKSSIAILKALTDSTPTRFVQWNSTTNKLEDTPKEFEIDSPVLLTCNNISVISKYLQPLIDRSHFIEFEPERSELLNKMKEIVKSSNGLEREIRQKVYNAIESYSPTIKSISLRDFMRGIELYKHFNGSGKFEEMMERQLGIDKKLVQMKRIFEHTKTTQERLTRWRMLGFSERDFYRWSKTFKDCQTANKSQIYA